METTCKKCSSTNVVHNGKVRNRQRYRCNSCGLNFVIGDRRDKTKIEVKALALLMYGSCKASYGMIARLLKPKLFRDLRNMYPGTLQDVGIFFCNLRVVPDLVDFNLFYFSQEYKKIHWSKFFI